MQDVAGGYDVLAKGTVNMRSGRCGRIGQLLLAWRMWHYASVLTDHWQAIGRALTGSGTWYSIYNSKVR